MEEDKQVTIGEQDLLELQKAFATVELFLVDQNSNQDQSSLDLTIQRFHHTKLVMRPERNHRRSHFHIEYKRQYSASYAIDTFECLAGNVPKPYVQPLLNWAKDRQASLQATWDQLCAGEDVRELVLVKEAT